MRRCLLISSDTHANPTIEQYRSYLEPAFRERYDEFAARGLESHPGRGHKYNVGGTVIDPFGKSVRKAWDSSMKEAGDESPASNGAIRTRDLDRDGVAGEVIFPICQTANDAPLLVGLDPARNQPLDLLTAGARAYNRWLADLCASAPERRAGVAAIPPLQDVEAVVSEIAWAKKAGLRGGIALPTMQLMNTPADGFLHHPRYEPIWAACEEMEMPVNNHIANLYIDYGGGPGVLWIQTHDNAMAHHRPFWFLLWSGVFERHPRLKWVATETGGTWAVFHLQRADEAYEFRNPELARKSLKLKPSEYWARQCYIGASPPSGRGEVEQRHILGVDNIMWGSDYPHREGTWPFTQRRLAKMFNGIPEADARKMAGLNAARVYGFDLAKLEPLVERIGPQVNNLGEAPSPPMETVRRK